MGEGKGREGKKNSFKQKGRKTVRDSMICLLPSLWLFFPPVPLPHGLLLSFSGSTYEWKHMLFFSVWLIPFSIIPSSSIHIAANGQISFFVVTKYYSVVNINHISFIHSSVDGHLGSFHNLAIVESAAINIGVHVSLCISTPVSLRYVFAFQKPLFAECLWSLVSWAAVRVPCESQSKPIKSPDGCPTTELLGDGEVTAVLTKVLHQHFLELPKISTQTVRSVQHSQRRGFELAAEIVVIQKGQ